MEINRSETKRGSLCERLLFGIYNILSNFGLTKARLVTLLLRWTKTLLRSSELIG